MGIVEIKLDMLLSQDLLEKTPTKAKTSILSNADIDKKICLNLRY